jgi:hypothetical protein
MQQLFGYSGVTSTAAELRNKPFNEDDFQPIGREAKTLLSILSNNAGLPWISSEVSKEEFVKAFQKWSEGTSSSRSGRHLGCLFADDGQVYTDDDPDPSNKIMGVYYNIAVASLTWGISLDRCHNSITTTIEKQPGCLRINKLRVIHLFEAY